MSDLVLLDLEKEQEIVKEAFVSKGKNTPFNGWACNGWPQLTMYNGEIVWQEEQA